MSSIENWLKWLDFILPTCVRETVFFVITLHWCVNWRVILVTKSKITIYQFSSNGIFVALLNCFDMHNLNSSRVHAARCHFCLIRFHFLSKQIITCLPAAISSVIMYHAARNYCQFCFVFFLYSVLFWCCTIKSAKFCLFKYMRWSLCW